MVSRVALGKPGWLHIGCRRREGQRRCFRPAWSEWRRRHTRNERQRDSARPDRPRRRGNVHPGASGGLRGFDAREGAGRPLSAIVPARARSRIILRGGQPALRAASTSPPPQPLPFLLLRSRRWKLNRLLRGFFRVLRSQIRPHET
jgi:hypothetical protein